MCACALDRLEDRVDEENAASSCTCPKSIWQQCTPRSGRSPTKQTKNILKMTRETKIQTSEWDDFLYRFFFFNWIIVP